LPNVENRVHYVNVGRWSDECAFVAVDVVCVRRKKIARRHGQKSETEIHSATGFSGVKTAENRNFAWNEAWEKANIAINAGKKCNP